MVQVTIADIIDIETAGQIHLQSGRGGEAPRLPTLP